MRGRLGRGSDLDGFIKPTIAGTRNAGDLHELDAELHRRYDADADLLCFENALRPLRTYSGGGRSS